MHGICTGQNGTKLTRSTETFFVALSVPPWTFPNLRLPSWKVDDLHLGEVLELGVRSPNVSVLLVRFVPFCRTR